MKRGQERMGRLRKGNKWDEFDQRTLYAYL
jgi:hypothetical protein